MPSADRSEILDTITTLALDIAKICADCADKATQIASLAGDLRAGLVDRGAVQDALDAQLGDGDLSDLHVRAATEAVVKAMKD